MRDADFPRRRATQMAVDLPQTTSKMEGPLVKQFSVFLPNKVGAMLDLVKLLNTQNIHVEVATQVLKLLAALVMAEVNVHFAYPLLIRPRGFAAIALHLDDTECASSVLMGEGFKLLSQNDISR